MNNICLNQALYWYDLCVSNFERDFDGVKLRYTSAYIYTGYVYIPVYINIDLV